MRNSSNGWTKRIPKLACTMEILLYRSAPSFKEFMNMTTLPQRLDEIMTDFISQVNTNTAAAEKNTIDQLTDSFKENL